MSAQQILLAAGAGIAGALMFAALLTGSVAGFILAYLAPLPLFLAGLALGVGGATIAAAAGALAMLMVGGLIFALRFAVIFAIINALPAFLMSRQALLNRRAPDGSVEWYPPGAMVLWLAGSAVAMFVALIVIMAGNEGGLEGFAQAFLRQAFEGVALPDLPGESREEMIAAVARYLPGIVAISWMLMITVNGVLAQGLLARFGRNLRPSPRMADITMPGWLPVAAAIAAAGALMPGLAGFVGGNLLLIALTVFAFAGLAVIHSFADRWGGRSFWLILIYAITIMFTWPAVLIAVLGVVETTIGLRRRFAMRPPPT